jgi:hypothetical protein
MRLHHSVKNRACHPVRDQWRTDLRDVEEMRASTRVVLVGGGIGGVAAAAELERVGVEWVLVERTPVPSEVGADALRAGFAEACPLVTTILDRIEGNSFITGVYSRRPRPGWTTGRLTLLGDAEDRRRTGATKVHTIAAASALVWNETDPVQTQARNGRFAGLPQLDPLARTLWGWLYQHDPTSAADVGRGLGTAGATARTQRPESQRAFEIWRTALGPEHHAGGWRGLRRRYNAFLTTSFPVTPRG